jgi:uncharacterized spore protein YtfJ
MAPENPSIDSRLADRIVDSFQSASDLIGELFGNVGAETAFSSPVEAQGRTIITAAETFVMAANGMGGGFGSSPSLPTPDDEAASNDLASPAPGAAEVSGGIGGGGGGAGTSFSRPVAAIIIGPDGVVIRPIVDWTKIGLAFLTTLGGALFMWMRIIRATRRGPVNQMNGGNK